MPGKYNIALIPVEEKVTDQIVKYAKTQFQVKPAEYLLGPNSLPHITLCHFVAEEKQVEDISKRIIALNQSSLELTFETQRSKTYLAHPIWGKWSWVSLMPDRQDQLKEMHEKMATIVRPTNAAFDAYDPHMTLINSYDKEQCKKINETPQVFPAFKGSFKIILGKLDDVGQVTEVLYDCSAKLVFPVSANKSYASSRIGLYSLPRRDFSKESDNAKGDVRHIGLHSRL